MVEPKLERPAKSAWKVRVFLQLLVLAVTGSFYLKEIVLWLAIMYTQFIQLIQYFRRLYQVNFSKFVGFFRDFRTLCFIHLLFMKITVLRGKVCVIAHMMKFTLLAKPY